MAYAIGLDSGGTRTRAVLVDRDGHLVAAYDEAGGGNPDHEVDAAHNVQAALLGVLERGGLGADQLESVVAGLAGVDSEADQEWATACLALPGLSGPAVAVNDAVVAQAGAFAGGPGIVVVAGTGSMITAVTESGETVTNDHYPHYAGGARHLAFDLVNRLLIGEHTSADEAFVREVLDYWEVADLDQFRTRIVGLKGADRQLVKRLYGGLAPLITAAADTAPSAGAALDRLVGATAVGVRLLAGHFSSVSVGVAPAGAVARAPEFTDRLAERLRVETDGRCAVVRPRLDPARGAALLALRRIGVVIDDHAVTNLGRTG